MCCADTTETFCCLWFTVCFLGFKDLIQGWTCFCICWEFTSVLCLFLSCYLWVCLCTVIRSSNDSKYTFWCDFAISLFYCRSILRTKKEALWFQLPSLFHPFSCDDVVIEEMLEVSLTTSEHSSCFFGVDSHDNWLYESALSFIWNAKVDLGLSKRPSSLSSLLLSGSTSNLFSFSICSRTSLCFFRIIVGLILLWTTQIFIRNISQEWQVACWGSAEKCSSLFPDGFCRNTSF